MADQRTRPVNQVTLHLVRIGVDVSMSSSSFKATQITFENLVRWKHWWETFKIHWIKLNVLFMYFIFFLLFHSCLWQQIVLKLQCPCRPLDGVVWSLFTSWRMDCAASELDLVYLTILFIFLGFCFVTAVFVFNTFLGDCSHKAVCYVNVCFQNFVDCGVQTMMTVL